MRVRAHARPLVFCCMLCCFVWFGFALYCLVLFVHVVWAFLSLYFF